MESSRADMSQGIRIPENGYSEQSVQFMDKVMEISGLGDRTFLPDGAPPFILLLLRSLVNRAFRVSIPRGCSYSERHEIGKEDESQPKWRERPTLGEAYKTQKWS